MNAQKMSGNGNLISCPKHGKTETTTKLSKVTAHVPSVRCHEEIMSKSSQFTIDDCVDACLVKVKERANNGNKNIKNKKELKSSKFKSKNVCDSSSAPVHLGKCLAPKAKLPKTVRTKSAPIDKQVCLEDSVDFIPVKLCNNDHRETQQVMFAEKHGSPINPPTLGVPDKRHNRGPTWDQILRGECQSDKYINKHIKPQRQHNYKLEACESSNRPRPNPQKKKVSTDAMNWKECKVNQENEIKLNSDKIINSFNPDDNMSYCSFFVSDPIKSLDFLIKQLREKVTKQPERDNIQKIISDMENALLKITNKNQVYSKDIEGTNVNSAKSSTSDKKPEFSDNRDLKNKNGRVDVIQLQNNLEESCRFLQSLCIKLKENCNNHTQEKEQLSLQLAESRRLLAISKSKEKDYEVTIGELRLKIQEAESKKDHEYQMIKELTDSLDRLKSENKVLISYKELVHTLGNQIKEINREKDNLNSKLHLKELEIEKLRVLLQLKENLNYEPRNIKKKAHADYDDNEVSPDRLLENKENSLMSDSMIISLNQEKPGIICSSQASGSPGYSPSPYNSWQHISSIFHRPSAASDITKDIANIFQNLKMKTDQNQELKLSLEIPSSSNSLWSDEEGQDLNSKIMFSDVESCSILSS